MTKPTGEAREWMLEDVGGMMSGRMPCARIADAHNAALAAACDHATQIRPEGEGTPEQLKAWDKATKQPTVEAQDEWTEGKVFAYVESEDYQGLADAINAALDAEREKVKHLQEGRRVDFENYSYYTKRAEKAEKELAAERERRIEAERDRDEFSRGCDRLADKLRYERMK